MQSAISSREAGELLGAALRTTKTGFVARINVTPGHLEVAKVLGLGRRMMAKVAGQRGYRNYAQAAAEPAEGYERSRLCVDRRGLLAELLVNDMLTLAGIEHDMQALISHTTEPGLDLTLGEWKYDVKAAGQVSMEWSAGPHTGRLHDDRCITINYVDHCDYTLEAGSAGYICLYFYMQGGVPVAADVFYYSLEQVFKLPIQGPAASVPTGGKDKRHFRVPLDFPDSRHREGHGERLEAAGGHKSPFPPAVKLVA